MFTHERVGKRKRNAGMNAGSRKLSELKLGISTFGSDLCLFSEPSFAFV